MWELTHNRLMALCPGLPSWASTRKIKPIWILLKEETVSGSGIRWAICKSAPRCWQTTTPAPHHSVLYRPDALPAAQPTASVHCMWIVQVLLLSEGGIVMLCVVHRTRVWSGWFVKVSCWKPPTVTSLTWRSSTTTLKTRYARCSTPSTTSRSHRSGYQCSGSTELVTDWQTDTHQWIPHVGLLNH